MVHFRREKFVPRGGPDGGDGGRGGDVILRGQRNLNTLLHFQNHIHFRAERGGNGAGAKKHGKRGPDLYIGGSFNRADNQPMQSIGRWDGSAWSILNVGDPGDGGGVVVGGGCAGLVGCGKGFGTCAASDAISSDATRSVPVSRVIERFYTPRTRHDTIGLT